MKPKRKEEKRIEERTEKKIEDSSSLNELQYPDWNNLRLSIENYRQGGSSAMEWPPQKTVRYPRTAGPNSLLAELR